MTLTVVSIGTQVDPGRRTACAMPDWVADRVRGKLDSKDWFLGAVRLVRASQNGGRQPPESMGMTREQPAGSLPSDGGPSGGRREIAHSARRPPYDRAAGTTPFGPAGSFPNRLAEPLEPLRALASGTTTTRQDDGSRMSGNPQALFCKALRGETSSAT
jgi:hypothetical protein